MRKVGKTVLKLATGEGNPRNGESTFLRLKDGSVMFAYTQYYGTDWADHAIAQLCACYSKDEGETWSEPEVLIRKDEKAENIMSPSLVRMNNGDLGIVYLRKEKMPDNGVVCMPVFRRSTDEGKTWSDWMYCGIPEGYYCVINNGVICQKNGRILVPMSYHGIRHDSFHTCTIDLSAQKNADIRFAYSDDDGASWQMLPQVLTTPFDDSVGFAEPGVLELPDGELWCWYRTGYGFQYESRSMDGGETWSTPIPNFYFSSPDAPMQVKPVGEGAVAVFNPVPLHCMSTAREIWGTGKRNPLVCAFSKNGGRSFNCSGKAMVNHQMDDFYAQCCLLEDDPKNSFCYPAILEVEGGFLVAYYDSADTDVCLNATTMKKILYTELA